MESGWLIPYHSGKRDGISRQCRDISHLPTVEGCMKDGKTQCEQPNALNILIQVVRLIAPSVASRVSKQLTSFHHHSTRSLSLRKRVLSNPSRPASSDAFATNGSNSCASQDVLFSNSYTCHNSFRVSRSMIATRYKNPRRIGRQLMALIYSPILADHGSLAP